VLDDAAQRPDGFDLTAFWSEWERDYARSLPTFTADVRLGPGAQRYRDALGTLRPREVRDETVEPDGWIRQTLVFDNAGIARAALLALAPDVDVVGPAALRDDIATVARAVVKQVG
jgi:hypothetical protein